jgi:hypothetical protein
LNFFNLIDILRRKDVALILYSLLERLPIIVFGDDPNKIEDLLIELTNLINFRKEIVFSTDFISKNEFNNLIKNEEVDYNLQRIQIRCPTNVALKAIREFNYFYSWLIGINLYPQNHDASELMTLIRKKIKKFLIIKYNSNKFTVELEGIDSKLINLSLEQNILQKISQDTDKSLARMKRVLLERAKLNNINDDKINILLDFEMEKNELKKNIFTSEIHKFYFGSKRAFFVLSRLNLLNSLDIAARIGSKTILETIDYEEASIERIISFIRSEWGEDYSNLIENGNKIFFVEKIDSLWG